MRAPALLTLLLTVTFAYPQAFDKEAHRTTYALTALKTRESVKIDGELNEPLWNAIKPSENFWQHWPSDKDKAQRRTEVRMAYDEFFIYIAATCFDSTASAENYTIQTLKRDQRFWDSDGFSVLLDPLGQATNGFLFGVNSYNVQSEGLIATNNPVNFEWDNRWLSATQRHADRWTVEMAIPFKTLRFEAKRKNWAINFIRNDIKANQYHTWAWVPVNFEGYDLGYTGSLFFSDELPNPTTNISLIPYTTASFKQNTITDGRISSSANAGFDAKFGLTPSLNLDVTVNPDFSQVEVDRQVTNLTRFSIFLPERRTFFLENDDLFSGYLYPELRPFYSRRIGLDNEGNAIPIIGGVRLSGNIDKKSRLGLMNIQTAGKGDFAAQNYTAASFQRRVLKRSYVKGYFLNRQGLLSSEQKQADPLSAYGRNSGVEAVYTNDEGSLSAWGGYHLSWKPGISKDNYIKNAGFQYAGRSLNGFVDINLVGTNYYADMGFVQRIENYDAARDSIIRLGFNQGYTELNYNIYPKKGKVNQHVIGFENFLVYNPNGALNERSGQLRYFIEFKNTSAVRLRWENTDTRLLFTTQFTEKDPLPVGKYEYNQFNAAYQSDSRKKVVFNYSARAGKLYSGDYQQYIAGITYRAQPWGNFTLDFERNLLKFKEAYGEARLFLIAPRIEINFSNSLFWTTFVQYNTQRNNFNINSRLQWRYKPMSDVFLVYTDNYFSDPFLKNKNRAFVFKANYWLNL